MCDSNFSQKGNLNEHISANHEVIQTLYSQKRNLNKHISAIHEVIQTFKKGDKMDTYQQFMK